MSGEDLGTQKFGTEVEPIKEPPDCAILPTAFSVADKASGEVYLEGSLARGVVPEDCFWTHCGGEGEDGCCLYLRKMNLELLQRCASVRVLLDFFGGGWAAHLVHC